MAANGLHKRLQRTEARLMPARIHIMDATYGETMDEVLERYQRQHAVEVDPRDLCIGLVSFANMECPEQSGYKPFKAPLPSCQTPCNDGSRRP
jgi:hypothetical protein